MDDADRLAPLRDRLYDAVVWGDPEELVSAREAYDKRQTLAERDANRDIAKEMGRHLKGHR